MRRLLFLLPLLAAGCRPGRIVAVSNGGRVASTTDGGTFVAGAGRVAEGGDGLAWSADGKALAISLKSGTLLWPSGRRIPDLSKPYAWSPDGRTLAGGGRAGIRIFDLATGGLRDTDVPFPGDALRTMPDGRLFVLFQGKLEIVGGPSIQRRMADVRDAVPTPDGRVRWIEIPVGGPNRGERSRARQGLAAPLRLGLWDPATGETTVVVRGVFGALLRPTSPERLSIPTNAALSPTAKGFAATFLELRGTPATMGRIVALYDRNRTTKAEQTELDRLLAKTRLDAVLAWLGEDGTNRVLDRTPLDPKSGGWGVDTLAFSPDGRWLAVGRKDRTLRIRMD